MYILRQSSIRDTKDYVKSDSELEKGCRYGFATYSSSSNVAKRYINEQAHME